MPDALSPSCAVPFSGGFAVRGSTPRYHFLTSWRRQTPYPPRRCCLISASCHGPYRGTRGWTLRHAPTHLLLLPFANALYTELVRFNLPLFLRIPRRDIARPFCWCLLPCHSPFHTYCLRFWTLVADGNNWPHAVAVALWICQPPPPYPTSITSC